MANQRRPPSDYTGRQRDKLVKQHQEAVLARGDEIGMATGPGPVATMTDEVTDYARPTETTQGPDGEVVFVEAPNRTVRVNADINQMTFGVGTSFDFKEGQQYKVSAALADHLEELGYVWH